MARFRKVADLCLLLVALAALSLLVPSGEILPEALNAYYVGETPAPYQFALRPYGLALASAFVLAGAVFVFLARKKHDASWAELIRFLTLAALLGICLSRALFCVANSAFYAQAFQQAAFLKIWEGGMSMTGAIGGFALAALILKRCAHEGSHPDALALAAAMFVFVARLGEKYAGTGFGADVEFSGIFTLPDEYGAVLNVWLMEALCALVIFIALAALIRFTQARPGDCFAVFFLLYGASQIFFESLRADRHMILGFVKVQQVFAMLMAAGGFIFFARRIHKTALAVCLSVLTAVIAFLLEKALDRLDISALVLYAGYIILLAAYAGGGLMMLRCDIRLHADKSRGTAFKAKS